MKKTEERKRSELEGERREKKRREESEKGEIKNSVCIYRGRTLPVKESSSESQRSHEDIKLNIDHGFGGQPAYEYNRPAGQLYNSA